MNNRSHFCAPGRNRVPGTLRHDHLWTERLPQKGDPSGWGHLAFEGENEVPGDPGDPGQPPGGLAGLGRRGGQLPAPAERKPGPRPGLWLHPVPSVPAAAAPDGPRRRRRVRPGGRQVRDPDRTPGGVEKRPLRHAPPLQGVHVRQQVGLPVFRPDGVQGLHGVGFFHGKMYGQDLSAFRFGIWTVLRLRSLNISRRLQL